MNIYKHILKSKQKKKINNFLKMPNLNPQCLNERYFYIYCSIFSLNTFYYVMKFKINVSPTQLHTSKANVYIRAKTRWGR